MIKWDHRNKSLVITIVTFPFYRPFALILPPPLYSPCRRIQIWQQTVHWAVIIDSNRLCKQVCELRRYSITLYNRMHTFMSQLLSLSRFSFRLQRLSHSYIPPAVFALSPLAFVLVSINTPLCALPFSPPSSFPFWPLLFFFNSAVLSSRPCPLCPLFRLIPHPSLGFVLL